MKVTHLIVRCGMPGSEPHTWDLVYSLSFIILLSSFCKSLNYERHFTDHARITAGINCISWNGTSGTDCTTCFHKHKTRTSPRDLASLMNYPLSVQH